MTGQKKDLAEIIDRKTFQKIFRGISSREKITMEVILFEISKYLRINVDDVKRF